jgi:hypothetical protein
MNKNRIFFGENGLTSTSANHVANLAKEAYASVEEKLNALQLYDEDISLLGSGAFTPVSRGATTIELQAIPDMIAEISSLKSLIAWLREGIKARKELAAELQRYSLESYCEDHGTEMPVCPDSDDYEPMTEDEYYGSLSIKERNAYYQLETKCATLGSFIHINGRLSEARKRLNVILNKPTVVNENGRDTIVTARKASVNPCDVEDLFFRLQAKHREYQAALNSIKHKCEVALEQDALAKRSAYSEAYSAYSTRLHELENKLLKWKQEQTIALEKLKIVIPDSLKPIYEKVCTLGK